MTKFLPKIALSAVLTLGLASTSLVAAAAPAATPVASSSSIVAGQAFAAAAVADTDGQDGSVSPQAVPAVVATAFVVGAASAAGAAVGAWVAGKIIGIWSVAGETPVAITAFD